MKIASFQYPFAICAHPGLGVEPTLIGDMVPHRALGQAQIGCHVNLQTGNVVVRDKVISLHDIGGELKLGYIYNSLSKKWTLAAGAKLSADQSEVKITEADGRVVAYHLDPLTGDYKAEHHFNGDVVLRYDATKREWVRFNPQSCMHEYFDAQGNLVKRLDVLGNQTTFAYDDGELDSVTLPSGATVICERTPQRVNIIYRDKEKSCLIQQYELDECNQLTCSRTADGYTVEYKYQNGILQAISQTDSTNLSLQFQHDGKIEKIGLGQQDQAAGFRISYSDHKTVLSDAAGAEFVATFADDQLASITQPGINGDDVTLFHYDENKRIQHINYPDQSIREFEYKNKHHLLSKIVDPDKTSHEFSYAEFNLPVLISETLHVDGKKPARNVHIYDYTFKGEYSAIRFVVSAAGRVTEYLLDPITGLEVGSRQFPLAFYQDDTFTLKNLIAWSKNYEEQFTHSNIIYKKLDRDQKGQIEAISVYSSVQASGDLSQSDISQTKNHIDIFGHITEQAVQIDAKNYLLTCSSFNRNHLPSSILHGANTRSPKAIEFEYQAQTTHALYVDHVAVAINNSQGNIRSQATIAGSVERKTDFNYGLVGELQAIVSVGNKVDKIFCDKKHQVNLQISPKGVAVGKEYHAGSRCEVSISYAIVVPAEYLNQGQEAIQAFLAKHRSAEDRVSYRFNNVNQEIQFEVDANGYVVEHRYDDYGHESMLIRYEEKLTTDELSVLQAGRGLERQLNREVDRITLKFYDLDGYLIAEQDPAGYVTTFTLDAAGRQTAKQHYLQPLAFSPGSHAELINAISSLDFLTSYYFYNGKNECELEVDQLGYITTHTYFADGKVATSARYADPVTADWLKTPEKRPEVLLGNKAQVTSYHYDELRRKTAIHYPNGKVEAWTYDNADHVTSHTSYDAREPACSDGDHFRQELYQYSGFGDLIATVNPFVGEMLRKIDLADLSSDLKQQKISEIWQKYAEQTVVDSAGLKIRSTDPYGNITKYFYDADKNLRFIIGPTGIVFEKRYNVFGEVILECHYAKMLTADLLQQIDGGYLQAKDELIFTSLASEKDAVTQYQYDKRGQVTEKINPEKYRSVYKHNAFREVTDEFLAVNSREPDLHIYHEYENRGLETMTVHTAENVEKIAKCEYQHYLGKKTKYIDPVGGTEMYQYDGLGRHEATQILNEDSNFTQIAGTSYDAYGRPLTHTDANQQIAYLSYEDDLRRITITKNGLKSSRKENAFGETIEQINHLGETIKEIHAPDGQVISTTDPNGATNRVELNLIGKITGRVDKNGTRYVTQYNQAWDVISKTDDEAGLKLITKFERNAFGLEREVTNPRGIKSINTHDRCGNLTLSIHDTDHKHATGLRVHVAQKYNGLGKVHTIKQGGYNHEGTFHAASLVKKHEHDLLGRETARVTDPENLNLRQEFEYDGVDQVLQSTNPNGEIELFYHNIQKRLRFEFNQLTENSGSLTEKQYTRSGKISFIRIHDAPISLAEIKVNKDLQKVKELSAQKISNDDLCTQFIYDEHDRERFIIKYVYDHKRKLMRGIITEKVYDAAHREIAIIEYADFIKVNNQSEITAENVERQIKGFKQRAQDRLTQYRLDKLGQKIVVAKDGLLTFNRFSKSGKLLEQTHYQADISLFKGSDLIDIAEFEKMVAAKATAQRRTRFYYDALDRLIFLVNPIGEIKRQEYDENNNTTKIARFHEPIDTGLSYEQTYTCISLLVPDRTANNAAIADHKFDNNDKEISVTDPLGYEDQYVRDELSRLRKHIDRRGNSWMYEHDSASRLVDKISPETTVTFVDEKDAKLIAEKQRQRVREHTEFDRSSRPIKVTKAKDLPGQRSIQTPHLPSGKISKTIISDIMVDDPSLLASMAQLPEKVATIEGNLVYDVRGNLLAEKNQDGLWSFYVYDSLNRLIFLVDKEASIVKYSYNAFGDRIKERKYAKPFSMNISGFTTAGIPLQTMLSTVKSSPKDRITRFKFDQHGNKIEVRKNAIIYYADNKIGKAEPDLQFKYNAFKDWVRKSEKIGDEWRHTYRWYDANGNLIAEVNATNHLTLYRYDAHSKIQFKFEFAESLSQIVDETVSIQDIVNKYLIKNPKSDRIFEYEYDARGGKIAEHVLDVQTQKLVLDDQGIPSLINISHKKLTKLYNYSPTEKMLSETNEKGKSTYHLYDERDIEVAVTELARGDSDDAETLVTPVTLKGIDAFGEVVATQQTVIKGSLANAADLERMKGELFSLNLPYSELLLNDKRGKLKFKQDALDQPTKFTYTHGGRIARELSVIKLWIPIKKDLAVEFSHVLHLEEKRFTYSKLGKPVATAWYRAGTLFKIMQARFNIFNEVTHEFLDDPKKGIIYKRDLNGHVWKMINSGATTLKLRNLLGEESLSLQAPDDDLSLLSYADLASILSWDAKRLERTEMIRNLRGSVIAKKIPIWFKTGTGIPSHQYILDRWDNALKSIDSLGHETDSIYNYMNHSIAITLPEVDDLGADGINRRKRLTILHGFDECQLEVGTTNGNGDTEGHVYDDANQWIKHILGDGTVAITRRLDPLGTKEILITDTGAIITRLFDLLRQPIKTIFPSGRFVAHIYDGKGGIACHEDPIGMYLRYNYDPFGNVWQRYLPNGELTQIQHDHNHLMTLFGYADAEQNWQRRYDGSIEWHKDLGKRLRIYESNFKNQVKRLYSTDKTGTDTFHHRILPHIIDPKHPSLYYPVADISAEGPRELNQEYEYGYGLLDRITDHGVRQITDFTNDTEGSQVGMRITDADQIVRHDIKIILDEIRRLQEVTDTHYTNLGTYAKMSGKFHFDGADNHRRSLFTLDVSCYYPNSTNIRYDDFWFDFNRAGLVTVHAGSLVNGIIQPTFNHGAQFTYNGTLRATELFYIPNLAITNTLGYDQDFQLANMYCSTGMRQVWTKNPAGVFYKLDQSIGTNYTSSSIGFNANRWVSLGNFTNHATGLIVDTNYTSFRSSGHPTHYVVTYGPRDASHTHDEFDLIYLPSDTVMLWSISAQRFSNGRPGPVGQAQMLYNASGAINGKSNSADEHVGATAYPNVYFETTHDKAILSKHCVRNNSGLNNIRQNISYQFLNSPLGQMFGGYYLTYDALHLLISHSPLSHQGGSCLVSDLFSPFIPFFPTRMVGRADMPNPNPDSNPLIWDEQPYFNLGMETYECKHGDTCVAIAQNRGQDASFATALANENGITETQSLPSGFVLIVPPYVNNYYKSTSSRSYNDFMNTIIGAIQPHIVTPLPPSARIHHGSRWFRIVVKVIAVVVVLIAAYYLGPWVLKFMPAALGVAGPYVAAGIAGAIGSVIGQGIESAAGVSHFSTLSVFETAVTAGVLQGMTAGTTLSELAAQAVEIASIEAGLQLTEMATGQRQHFDVKSILVQVAASIASLQAEKAIDSELAKNAPMNSVAKNLSNSSIQGALGALTGTHPDYDQMIASLIGTGAGSTACSYLPPATGSREDINEQLRSAEQQASSSSSSSSAAPTTTNQNKGRPTLFGQTSNEHGSSVAMSGGISNKRSKWEAYVDAATRSSLDVVRGVGDALGDAAYDTVNSVIHANSTMATISMLGADALSVLSHMDRGGSSAARLQSFGHDVVQGFKDKYYHLGEDLSSGQSYRVARGATHALLTASGIVVGGSAVGINGLAARTAGKVRLFDRAAGVVENSVQVSTKHPLAGLSSENVVRLVNEIGLSTPKDQLILWSGLGRGSAGVKLSQDFARANGGVTLEMTAGGKWLDKMDLFGQNSPFTTTEALQIWDNVSRKMIQQASGQVRSVIGQVKPESIYRSEQAEILMNNRIVGLDELYIRPRYVFGK